MRDITVAPRRRPLRRLFVLPVLVVVAAVAWSGFWFYAASEANVAADAWRAREAKSGRIYDCAHREVTGFPFRLNVTCHGATVTLVSQSAGESAKTPITVRLHQIEATAQVYDPKRITAMFQGPATISVSGGPSLIARWSKGQSSVVGLPATPQNVSLMFDNAVIDRLEGSTRVPLARAKHIELRGRVASGSPADHPVIESVLKITQGSIQGVHPLLAQPFDADVQAKLSGLKDFKPEPWPQRFRDMQAAGGHVEIVRSRIQQGDVVAVAAGRLGLDADGRLDGELQMTVAGIEKVIPKLGIDKMLKQGVPQATLDRIAPGVKTADLHNLFGALNRAIPGLGEMVKNNANIGVEAAVDALGTPATLEGRKARAFPLRFADGAVFLGPLKVADIPPLF
jgi:hypothetical protein